MPAPEGQSAAFQSPGALRRSDAEGANVNAPRTAGGREPLDEPASPTTAASELVHLDWRPYRFRLPRALVTAHGALQQRQGWLLRLRGPHGLGWGEAVAWPEDRTGQPKALAPPQGAWRREELEGLLPSLPAPLACAVGAALAELDGEPVAQDGGWLPAPASAWLLPAGEAALPALTECLERWARNPAGAGADGRAPSEALEKASLFAVAPSPACGADPRSKAGASEVPLTLKWKVAAVEDALERDILTRLLALLPPTARLRLDANGGWDRCTATAWARRLAGEARLEWLEQPLDPTDAEGLLALARLLPVALDESLRHASPPPSPWQGWQVRRPLLEGDPRPLLAALRRGQPRQMVSTALETGIGRRWLAHLAALQSLGPTPVAPGLAPGWRPAGELFSADPQRVWRAAGRCR
ncbi:MAG: o-succinylbenzoate synthase [Synechococcaceae cyanobacterium]|nr:o-succinylbenzoate synthase [Synechococcaceae cyanobacterium]